MAPKDHFLGRHYEALLEDGPFGFLNPTARYFSLDKKGWQARADGGPGVQESPTPTEPTVEHHVYHVWRSRDNRKGRHAVAVSPEFVASGGAVPQPTDTLPATLRGIGKMFLRFPVWDISYDVAVIFTLGSVIWCFNGFFVWLPLADPWTEFEGEVSMGGGITAFLGATVFEIGSILLMLEAVNENRADCFGWALEDAIEGSVVPLLHPEHEGCKHSHRGKKSLFKGSGPAGPNAGKDVENQQGFVWWPSWYDLRTHYFRDVGFLACFFQMIGATIFWIAGFTSLPPIYDALSPYTPALNGAYWLPQVVGGTGFIISSFLFMLEVQHAWYVPNLNVLGWHIGFWNLIGAIGFTLCGSLGFAVDQPGMEYALTLATFVASWAFLIGSLFQWFESLNKYPVTIETRASRIPSGRDAGGGNS